MHPEALSQLSGLSRGLPGFWNTPPFHLWWQRPLPAGHTRLRGAGEDRPLTVSFVHHGMDDHWKHAPVQVKVQLRKKGGEGSETGWRRSAKQAGGAPSPTRPFRHSLHTALQGRPRGRSPSPQERGGQPRTRTGGLPGRGSRAVHGRTGRGPGAGTGSASGMPASSPAHDPSLSFPTYRTGIKPVPKAPAPSTVLGEHERQPLKALPVQTAGAQEGLTERHSTQTPRITGLCGNVCAPAVVGGGGHVQAPHGPSMGGCAKETWVCRRDGAPFHTPVWGDPQGQGSGHPRQELHIV